VQVARAGGKAFKKFPDMSRARSVLDMEGSVVVRREGMEWGVEEEVRRRWVVPVVMRGSVS